MKILYRNLQTISASSDTTQCYETRGLLTLSRKASLIVKRHTVAVDTSLSRILHFEEVMIMLYWKPKSKYSGIDMTIYISCRFSSTVKLWTAASRWLTTCRFLREPNYLRRKQMPRKLVFQQRCSNWRCGIPRSRKKRKGLSRMRLHWRGRKRSLWAYHPHPLHV